MFSLMYPPAAYTGRMGASSAHQAEVLSGCHKESIFSFSSNSCFALACAANHETVCPFINGQNFGVPFCSSDLCFFLLTRPNCLKIFPFCCQCLKLLNVSEVINPPFFLTLYIPVYHSTCYCSKPRNCKCSEALSDR